MERRRYRKCVYPVELRDLGICKVSRHYRVSASVTRALSGTRRYEGFGRVAEVPLGEAGPRTLGLLVSVVGVPVLGNSKVLAMLSGCGTSESIPMVRV